MTCTSFPFYGTLFFAVKVYDKSNRVIMRVTFLPWYPRPWPRYSGRCGGRNGGAGSAAPPGKAFSRSSVGLGVKEGHPSLPPTLLGWTDRLCYTHSYR